MTLPMKTEWAKYWLIEQNNLSGLFCGMYHMRVCMYNKKIKNNWCIAKSLETACTIYLQLLILYNYYIYNNYTNNNYMYNYYT